MTHKLNERSASHSGCQLAAAIDGIQTRQGWSDGDTIAVAIAACTEVLARRLGPVRTIDLVRDYASALADQHSERSRL